MKKGKFYTLPDKFKYSTTFASKIEALVSEDVDKYLSVASQNNLKKFLPKDVDFNKKIDFLAFCGNAFVANRLNGNDDGVSSKEAIEIASLFPWSYVDVEHKRERLIGVVTSASFSEFGTNKPLTEEEVKSLEQPFNVVIGGILWRAINPDLMDYIETSNDPNAENYGKVSISWELAFSKYNLLLIDPKKKNFEDGKMVTDAKEINRLEKMLKAEGGSGIDENGNKIGRIIVDEPIPLGVGLTETPAGDVGPITVESHGLLKLMDDNSDSKLLETVAKEEEEVVVCPHCKEKYGKNLLKHVNGNTTCVGCGVQTKTTDWTGFKSETKESYSDSQSAADPMKEGLATCEASAEHYIEKCSCGNRIGGCRCNSPNKIVKITENGCSECLAKTGAPKKVAEKQAENTITSPNKKPDGTIITPLSPNNKHLISVNPDYKFGKCPNCGYHGDYQTLIKSWAGENSGTCPSCKKKAELNDWQYSSEDTAENKLKEQKNEKILSQSINLAVNNNDKIMKLTNVKDLTDEALKECKAADVQELLSSEIKKISDDYVKKKEEQDSAISNANKTLEETKKQYTELEKQFNDLKAEQQKLVQANQDREKSEVFSARMGTIEEKFELNEAELKIVGSKVKTLGDDNEFNTYLAEMEVLLAAKKKGKKAMPEPDDDDKNKDKKETKASQDTTAAGDVEGAIKNGQQTTPVIPNSTDNTAQLTLAEKAKKAFDKESLVIGHAWDLKRKERV